MSDAPNLSAAGDAAIPLVVDVDGTLIKTDLLQEAALQLVAHHPFQVPMLPVWMLAGKAVLKTRLAERVDLRIDSIPLREQIVARIRQAQDLGRPVYLASASERRQVEALAERIGGIAGVFGTEGHVNLSGSLKAARLEEAFGRGGFDYIGDAAVDMPVWDSARKVLMVAHSAGFARRVAQKFPDVDVVARTAVQPRAWLRAMRPYQWTKNALVFLPMLAAHRFDLHSIATALLAFLCFSLAASSAYCINDLLDLPGDRAHHRKRNRPFAAGDVSPLGGVMLGAVLMISAFALATFLPVAFLLILGLYVATTLAYSLFLKRRALIDVITLGGLYTVRVLGGVTALSLIASPWLLMFSLFMFLHLALVKRCSELVALRDMGESEVVGRSYRAEDLNVLFALGAAAGYGVTLVVTLYLSSPEVITLYSRPMRMWLLCPLLLYWTSRVLLIAGRGRMHDDPLIFALRDWVSWVSALCAGGIVLASI